ncbi:MAG TPA: hypothetical protein VFW13_13720 [Phenylobacterium sp.]|nr:hypothetical protein [Phenylobacterium sp.]
MVRNAVAALAAALLLSGPRTLAATPSDEAAAMRDFFTGTLEIDNPAGQWSAKRYFAPDHTYRETGSDGQIHGVWAIEGGKICTTRDNPTSDPDRTARYCNEGVGRHAGEKWGDSDPVTGNLVLFNLKAGR